MKKLFRKHLLFLFALALSMSGFAQKTELHFVKVDTNYSWHNSTKEERDSFYFGLPSVKNSRYQHHIRLSNDGQIIDLYSEDGSNFQGTMVNSIAEHPTRLPKKTQSPRPTQIVYQKIALDSLLSTQVATALIASGQFSIPHDSLLKRWLYGLHCGGLFIESYIEGDFREDAFSCFFFQDSSTLYYPLLRSNYDLVHETFELQSRRDSFIKMLPKGRAYRDGSGSFHVMTEEQEAGWERDKPMRDHLYSKRDTINRYIKTKLDSLTWGGTLSTPDSPSQFHLSFNKKGRLKKIKTPEINLGDGLSYNTHSRIEIYRCKRQIRKAFRQIDLEPFDMRHDFDRTLSPQGGNWFVWDSMIY